MYEVYQDHPKQARLNIRVVLAVVFLACAIGIACGNGIAVYEAMTCFAGIGLIHQRGELGVASKVDNQLVLISEQHG